MADEEAVTDMMIGQAFQLFTVFIFAFYSYDGWRSGSVYLEHHFNCNEKMFLSHPMISYDSYQSTTNSTFQAFVMNHILFHAIQSKKFCLNLQITSYTGYPIRTYPIYPKHSIRSHPTNSIPTLPIWRCPLTPCTLYHVHYVINEWDCRLPHGLGSLLQMWNHACWHMGLHAVGSKGELW